MSAQVAELTQERDMYRRVAEEAMRLLSDEQLVLLRKVMDSQSGTAH
jgi:hypothetical protein